MSNSAPKLRKFEHMFSLFYQIDTIIHKLAIGFEPEVREYAGGDKLKDLEKALRDYRAWSCGWSHCGNCDNCTPEAIALREAVRVPHHA